MSGRTPVKVAWQTRSGTAERQDRTVRKTSPCKASCGAMIASIQEGLWTSHSPASCSRVRDRPCLRPSIEGRPRGKPRAPLLVERIRALVLRAPEPARSIVGHETPLGGYNGSIGGVEQTVPANCAGEGGATQGDVFGGRWKVLRSGSLAPRTSGETPI